MYAGGCAMGWFPWAEKPIGRRVRIVFFPSFADVIIQTTGEIVLKYPRDNSTHSEQVFF